MTPEEIKSIIYPVCKKVIHEELINEMVLEIMALGMEAKQERVINIHCPELHTIKETEFNCKCCNCIKSSRPPIPVKNQI